MPKRERERRKGEAVQLEMTPMIDVVFQLLIFFLVSLKQEDILTDLQVSRPAPENTRPPEEQPEDLLSIQVYNHEKLGGDGFVYQGRKVALHELERHLQRVAGHSRNVSVIIKCTGDSPHANLVRLLDICAKVKLTNLAVFSL